MRQYRIVSIARKQVYALNVPDLMNSESLVNAINACLSIKTIQMSACYIQDVWSPDGLTMKHKFVSPAFLAFTTFMTLTRQLVFAKEATMKLQIHSTGMSAFLNVEMDSLLFSLKTVTT